VSALRRQAMLTAAVVVAVLVAIFLAARMMYVSDRDALLFSILVLGIGVVSLRVAALAERERSRVAA
jgi:fucose permease